MGKIVTVKTGFFQVQLPPYGLTFNAGQSTTLTDAEYSALPMATTRAITTGATVADPSRPVTGGSATVSDATSTAKGIVQLSGDLSGTAAAPTVPGKSDRLTVTAVKSSAYTANPGELVRADISGGSWILALPVASSKWDVVVKIVGATSATAPTTTLTVQTQGTDIINTAGQQSVTMRVLNRSKRYTSDGSGTIIVSGGDTDATVEQTISDGRYVVASKLYLPSPHVRAMANEVATAVTFTDVGSTTSTIASAKNWSALSASAPFVYDQADMTTISSTYKIPLGPTSSSPRAADQSVPFEVKFDFDDQIFEIDTNANSTNTSLRVWANEQVSATFGPTSGTGRRLIKVDFGSRAKRRIVIEFDNQSYFAGINTAPTATVTKPSFVGNLTMAGMGDSYMAGAGSPQPGTSYFTQMARELGVAQHRRYFRSGTGFLTSYTNDLNYGQRLNDLLSFQPDIVFVAGSINDSSQTATALQTAATTFLTNLKSGLPSTSRIVLSGLLNVRLNYSGALTTAQTLGAALAAAAATVGVSYVDTANGANIWFTGSSGNVGATAGLGNVDYYQSGSYAGHPSTEGHRYLGKNLARDVAAALNLSI